MKKNNRILITGGAGFIGSHLSDIFLAKGYRVIVMDNLLTGKMENIAHNLKNKDFKFIKHNVTEHIDIKGDLFAILHFASPASPADYLKYPIPTLKVGALGTHNALGLALAKKCRILLASTSEVYGDPLINPQVESYWGNVNPIGPRGVYDEAKRFAEAITMAYHRYHGVDTKIVRIFNTYGPRMRANDGRAIPNFLSQALKDMPITMYGSGSQTRSFCYVSDLIDGLYKLLMSKEHEPVNIGNPNEMSLLKLAKLIIKMTDSRSSIVYEPLPVDDPKVRCPDISKAKKLLKWGPRINIDEGLRNTIPSFR
jgi:dTDP-glucose 4,6-dehydratase